MNGTSRSFLMTVESATGTIASTNKNTDIQEVIAKNNYSRIRFSEPEGLVARINPISDQSTEIKGFISLNVHTLTTSKKKPQIWGFIVTATSKGFVDRFAPDEGSLASLRRAA